MAAAIGIVALLLGAAGEWMHRARARRARALAFGPGMDAAAWVGAAPVVRVLGLTLAAFGCALLLQYEPALLDRERADNFSKRLLICLDVSPSMYAVDAGPDDLARHPRALWAYQAVRPLIQSLDPADTRISLTAFYTDSVPILIDTHDFNLVHNVLNGLPLHTAFNPGGTDLVAGVNTALRMAGPWAEGSATLLVISDGDSEASLSGIVRVPPSIAQSIVVGVGDAGRASAIGDRRTRQDATSLRTLAMRLGGEYIDCNQSALPARFVHQLRMAAATPPVDRAMRDIALACAAAGSLLSAAIGPLLLRFGRRSPRSHSARRARGVLT